MVRGASVAGATLALVLSGAACLTGEIGSNVAPDGDGGAATGQGGDGAAGGGGASTGGGGATGGTGGTGGGGGQPPECTSPEDCPGNDSDCAFRTCEAGVCDFVDAAMGATCSDGGGQLCDGVGNCVECLEQSDCTDGICQGNQCVPASCSDGTQNGDESAVDCGGSCAPCSNSMGCNGAADCVSGFCDGGTCAPCGTGDCGATEYCDGGTCADKKAGGALCNAPVECSSGFCPGDDGVCCNTACGATCQACVAGKTGGSNGICDDVSSGLDPEGECPAQGAATCDSNGQGCNGNGSCILYPSGTSCGSASCSGGQQTAASTCDGNGTCQGGATSACAPYTCGANSCKTSCNGNGDCVSGYECQSSQCVQPGCLGSGPATTPLDSQEQALLVLINNHRANNNVGPLTACTSLNRSAQGHSEDMRDNDYFSHTGLNNSSFVDRSCDACYDHACPLSTAMAENIAAGNSGAQGTFNQWLNSPGHNANMLSGSYTMIGIGRATGGGTYGTYWTNVFGGANEASCN